MKRILLAVSLALLPEISLGGQPLSELAGRVSAAARKARVARISVLPLSARSGLDGHDGEVLADMLTERLVAEGRVRVVERTRLSDVMAERRLGSALGSDSGTPHLEAAEAVVTGSYVRDGARMRASVRLVNADTGEILAAAEESFGWSEPAEEPGAQGAWTITVPAPEFMAEVPPLPVDAVELRDAPNDDSCADAAGRADRITSGILDIKARYWAWELKKGYSPYAITKNPGSEISDPELKARFYDAMKSWFHKPFVPDLSREEFERMRREEARASDIASRCGL
ncbi:MAG: FlgO family outer membrane protein [Elusimicrobiota bacterium]